MPDRRPGPCKGTDRSTACKMRERRSGPSKISEQSSGGSKWQGYRSGPYKLLDHKTDPCKMPSHRRSCKASDCAIRSAADRQLHAKQRNGLSAQSPVQPVHPVLDELNTIT